MLIAFSRPEKESILIQVQFQPGQNKMAPQKRSRSQKSSLRKESTHQTDDSSGSVSSDEPISEPILGSDVGVVAIYPRMSRILKETGKVVVEIVQGSTDSDIKVHTSSGYERLDESALQAAQKALAEGKFTLYLKDKSRIQVSFIFRLVE